MDEEQPKQQFDAVTKEDDHSGADITFQGDNSDAHEDDSSNDEGYPPIKQIRTTRLPSRAKQYLLIGILVLLILIPIIVLASIFGSKNRESPVPSVNAPAPEGETGDDSIVSFESAQVALDANQVLFFENDCIRIEPLMQESEADAYTGVGSPPEFCPSDFSVSDIQDMQLYDPFTLVVSLNTERVYVYSREVGNPNPTTKWVPLKNSAFVPYIERTPDATDKGFGKTAQLVAQTRLFVTSSEKTYYYKRISGDSPASGSWVLDREWSDLNHVVYQDSTQLALYNTTHIVVYNIQAHQVLATNPFWQVDRSMPAAVHGASSQRLNIHSVVLLDGYISADNLVIVYEPNDEGTITLENTHTDEVMTFDQEGAYIVGDFIVLPEEQQIYSILHQQFVLTDANQVWENLEEERIVTMEAHDAYIAIVWESPNDTHRHVQIYYESFEM